MSIFTKNFLHEIPADIQKYIMELSQYYVLDNLLENFSISMTEFISTRAKLEKQQEDIFDLLLIDDEKQQEDIFDLLLIDDEKQQEDIFDLSSSINNRSKIITKLKKIGLCEKKEEINEFLQDHINKYGKDIAYNIMKNKIDEKYNFYKTYILYRNY